MPKNATYNWDSHAVNCHIFDDARFRFPYYDQAVAALIEDDRFIATLHECLHHPRPDTAKRAGHEIRGAHADL